MNELDRLLNLPAATRKAFFDKLEYYTYALCEIDDTNKRVPFYIGKGKNDRCLMHLDDKKDSGKTEKINFLIEQKKLGIDILAYKLDETTSIIVESVCIDLLNIDNLTNIKRGHGDENKRLPINQLVNLLGNERVKILPEHRGVAFLLEKTFRHDFGDLEILEYTRGIWSRKQRDDVKFAYATFRGIIKEVYEIYTWVPAGTQQYFTRVLDPEKVGKRYEFVGKKASESIRNRYIDKLISKPRSFGDPFVRVGFEE